MDAVERGGAVGAIGDRELEPVGAAGGGPAGDRVEQPGGDALTAGIGATHMPQRPATRESPSPVYPPAIATSASPSTATNTTDSPARSLADARASQRSRGSRSSAASDDEKAYGASRRARSRRSRMAGPSPDRIGRAHV